jgi:hypothetical protein
MSKKLALDLGTSTGWAWHTSEGRIKSGTQTFRPGRFEGGGMRYPRCLRRRRLSETQSAANGIEEVRRHAGVDAADVCCGLLATLTARCENHRIPYAGVTVGTVIRRASGKGNADKAAMVAAMRAYRSDDNEVSMLLRC